MLKRHISPLFIQQNGTSDKWYNFCYIYGEDIWALKVSQTSKGQDVGLAIYGWNKAANRVKHCPQYLQKLPKS